MASFKLVQQTPNEPERNHQYIIQQSIEQSMIEVWSTKRLPFGPKEWLKDLRQDIRTAVGSLENRRGYILHALYGTYYDPGSEEFYDVENILFYNVGPSCFSHVAQYGICFERSPWRLTLPPTLLGYLHYHRYAMMDKKAGFSYWKMGRQLARWENITIPHMTSSTKLASVWHAFISTYVEILYMPREPLKRFGLKLTVTIPNNIVVNIATFMKPLLDGLIASFHTHSGENLDILSQRVGQNLHLSSKTIAELLCRRDRAILGERQLLWPYRSNVQWNPADHLCLAAELHIQTSRANNWAVSGTLFEIDAIDLPVDSQISVGKE